MFKSTVALALVFAATAAAQTQTMWGQCGGRNWRGSTACPTKAWCVSDGNEWYSQCVPMDKSEGGAVETRVLTTLYSVGGPAPTVVTTYITFLTPVPTPAPPPPQWVTTLTVVPDAPLTTDWWQG